MRLHAYAATVHIAIAQIGLAPSLGAFIRSRRSRTAAVARAQAARRHRRALAAVGLCLGFCFSVIFWPPSHGAMLIVTPPWFAAQAAEAKIAEAGGVVLSAQDGDVRLFGFAVARTVIGAGPSFRSRVLWRGALPLDARPVIWLREQAVAFRTFLRGDPPL
ncbi:MAG: hypothetical protein MRY74_15315 [Neomegalonema sp.]|nr:hypothetical protein [Neomegalonema sp.]